MKTHIILAVTILALGLLANGQKPVHVIGTKIEIVPPAGFSKAERFTGFISEETGASIMIVELPDDFTKFEEELKEKGFTGKGMTLLSQEEASFGKLKGYLFLLSQEANGIICNKWVGIFGDKRCLFLVNGIFPSGSQKSLSVALKQSVLTATVTTKPANISGALPFNVSPAGDLKISGIMMSMLILSKSGNMKSNVQIPFMVVSASLSEMPYLIDHKTFVKAMFFQKSILKDVVAKQTKPIRINGLSGYETIGTGMLVGTGAATLYQVVLFDGDDSYVMQGFVSQKLKSKYIPIFRKIARSFRRIPVKS
jgi:hypothetical protein